jgi:hypothetical protein
MNYDNAARDVRQLVLPNSGMMTCGKGAVSTRLHTDITPLGCSCNSVTICGKAFYPLTYLVTLSRASVSC